MMPTSPPAGAPRAGFFGRATLSARGMRSVSHSRTSSPVHDSVRQTYTLRAASHRIAKAHPPLARPGDLGIVTLTFTPPAATPWKRISFGGAYPVTVRPSFSTAS